MVLLFWKTIRLCDPGKLYQCWTDAAADGLFLCYSIIVVSIRMPWGYVTISISTTFADNLLGTGTDGVATQIGGGVLLMLASGGSPPAGPNEPVVGSTLATFTFSAAGSQGSPSNGTMVTAFSNTVVTATGTGTADYFRINNSSAVALVQGSVGTAIVADWQLSSVAITSGDNVTITGTPTIQWVVS